MNDNCRQQEEPAILILQAAIMCVSHVCSLFLFVLLLRMNGMHRTQFDHSPSCNLITHVLTTYHMKLAHSTPLEQKRFDLRLLLPAFCNLWLSLVLMTGNLE